MNRKPLQEGEKQIIENLLNKSKKIGEELNEKINGGGTLSEQIKIAEDLQVEFENMIRELPEGRLMDYLDFTIKTSTKSGVYKGIFIGVAASAILVFIMSLIV